MKENFRLHYLIPMAVLYLAVPLLYVYFGDFPSRTALKDTISLVTVGAFFLMLGQFYLSRLNRFTLEGYKMSGVMKLHRIIGYVFIPVLFIHPFLLVVPRYFEAGVDPTEAFRTILTTFGTSGIIMGMVAMVLMIVLGVTSVLRNRLPLTHTTWRAVHGLLSAAFVILATWHAVNMGRHTDTFLSTYMIVASAVGVAFLVRQYLFPPSKRGADK